MKLRHPIHLLLLVVLLGSLLAGCSDTRTPRLGEQLQRTDPWPAEVVSTVSTIPVMHAGRCMPLSTLAAFTLYSAHGRRDVQFVAADVGGRDQKHKLSPTEWLLDMWCYPAQAAEYPLFRIENVGVLSALGFEHGGQRQGFEYLSYSQLMPVGDKLQELARKYRPIPASKRSEVEEHIVSLFSKLLDFHHLYRLPEALGVALPVHGDALRSVLGGRERVTAADVVSLAEPFRAFVSSAGQDIENEKYGNLGELLRFLQAASAPMEGTRLFPPVESRADEDTWLTVDEAIRQGMNGNGKPQHASMLRHLSGALLAQDIGKRADEFRAYADEVRAAATARGELGTVDLEAHYYSANWHFHAMMTFLLGFVVAVVGWVVPRSKAVWWSSMIISTGALGMLVADLWMRCLITGYGPIQRLYDTFLFIAGGGALLLLIAECFVPRRIALALAPAFGALLILLARLFEVMDGNDTLQPLQAVLLSNFWLAVHVPTINLGYASALVAAAVANAWIFVRVMRIAAPREVLPKALVRVAYGITCFSLATSVVGTILGGVWANDSWGRFWGWDPKENGALLICLAQIALLHARMVGMVRDTGFVLATSATGMVVVFSWFHTNLLQVGLHAYGFSSALRDGVWWSYCVQFGFLVVGAADVLLRPNPVPRLQSADDVPPLPASS